MLAIMSYFPNKMKKFVLQNYCLTRCPPLPDVRLVAAHAYRRLGKDIDFKQEFETIDNSEFSDL